MKAIWNTSCAFQSLGDIYTTPFSTKMENISNVLDIHLDKNSVWMAENANFWKQVSKYKF